MLTLEDAVRRHMIVLERERSNLGTMQALCTKVLEEGAQLSELDADRYLAEMEQMEQEGTRFVNIKKKDTVTRYLGPLGAALIFVALMAGIIAFLVWAFTLDPEAAPPLPLVIAFIAIPAVIHHRRPGGAGPEIQADQRRRRRCCFSILTTSPTRR